MKDIDDEDFEAWMERMMERFDKLDEPLERLIKQKNFMSGDEILDNQDLCQLLKVDQRTLQRYRKKVILPSFKLDGRNYYRASDVHKLIREKF